MAGWNQQIAPGASSINGGTFTFGSQGLTNVSGVIIKFDTSNTQTTSIPVMYTSGGTQTTYTNNRMLTVNQPVQGYITDDSISISSEFKDIIQKISGKVEIVQDQEVEINMPDGSVIDIDRSGNFKVVDKDAKIKYKANRVREFNRYINASDLLEEFIRFLGSLGANRGQVLNVPIEMFIKWLIFRAAQEDDEDIPQEVRSIGQNLALPAPRHNIRCNWCGKYISKDKFAVGVKFCNGVHLDRFLAKQNLAYARVIV